MRRILVVVDMQNDFIDGVLGTAEAVALVDPLAKAIRSFEGEVVFTRDTHGEFYAETQEGRNLPVPHCIRGTIGWEIRQELWEASAGKAARIFDKEAFGSRDLVDWLSEENSREPFGQIIFTGVCTDICVISNVLAVKTFLPEAELVVEEVLCAGVIPERHRVALAAMEACQVRIRTEKG